jgi:hypothetical protein
MKRKIILFSSLVVAAIYLLGVNSCKKEEEAEFILQTLLADGIDLNGATPPSNVAPEPTIVATFSSDVDAATANATNITLTRDYDNTAITLNITVSGNQITIVPDGDLGTGALYELKLKGGLTGTNGAALAELSRAFTTEGVFAPSGAIAYWNFNDTPDEQVSGNAPSGIVNLSYGDSYSANAGKAGSFDGTTSIVEFANADAWMNTPDFTLSFWVKTNSSGHVDANGNPKGHFVLGLGAFKGFQFEVSGDYSSCKLAASYELADGTTASEDLWFAGDGQTGATGGWQGWTFCKDLTGSGGVPGLLQDKWANVVCVYNSTTREGIMYINGEKMKVQDFDLWPDGDPKQGVAGLKYGGSEPDVVNELAFGFIQSRAGTMWDNEPWGGYDFPTANHFGGMLDDVRIYHRVLSEAEISLMYDSAK